MGPEHLSQEPHYIHDEMSDASTDSDLTLHTFMVIVV
jgi:hypothetical protein